MRRAAAILLLPAALLLPACPTPPPPGCDIGILGSSDGGIQIEIFQIAEDRQAHDVLACGTVDLVEPPQGNRVIFVGARATNLDGCGVQLTGTLRDPTSNSVLASDGRTVNFRPIPGRPGWGTTDATGDLSNGFAGVANIPVCPNTSPRDVQRQDQILEVRVSDRAGRHATYALHVIPQCVDPDPDKQFLCECTCAEDSGNRDCASRFNRDAGHFTTGWDAGPVDPGSCVDGGAPDR